MEVSLKPLAENKIFTRDKLKHRIETIENNIKEYLNEIEKNDKQEMREDKLTENEIREIINRLEEKREEYKKLAEDIEKTEEKQISITDKDARLKKKRNGKCSACYNVQIASDAKSRMIVDFEVTNHTNDTQELSNMAIKAKETLETDYLEVLADSGYENRVEFEKCMENNIRPIVNIKSTEKENGCYSKDEFIYDRTKDMYICPNNGELVCVWHNTNKKGKRILRNKVYKNEELCKKCEKAKECFENNRGYRRIERWEKENIVDTMKTKEAREKLRKRKGIIELIYNLN